MTHGQTPLSNRVKNWLIRDYGESEIASLDVIRKQIAEFERLVG
jgi:hypothetical protein